MLLHSHAGRLICLLFALTCGAPGVANAAPPASEILLTNAAQIRALTPAQAARGLPVLLRGVVVDESHPRERALILADEGTEIYLFANRNLFAPYHPRDVLEIHGVTSAGEFAPCIATTEARKVGTTALPAARAVTYRQVLTGALDAQLIALSGVVRQCWQEKDDSEFYNIELAIDGGTIPVRLSVPRDPELEPDAEIHIEAICLYRFNQQRQALGPVLQVPRGLPVRIEKRAPADPFAANLRSAASLLQFSPQIPSGHRVHVRGVVTRSQRGSLLWIRDKTSGLRIQTSQVGELTPGDEIDVLGFPSYGQAPSILENAIFNKIGTTTPPDPLVVTNVAEAYLHQDNLVAIDAELIEIRPVMEGIALSLERGSTIFKAVLAYPATQLTMPDWRPGSLVRVAGICNVIDDDSRPVMGMWHPKSFQLLLRSPSDLAVIKAPTWWSTGHLILLLSLISGASLVAIAVVLWLARHRLNEQARRRAMAESEFAAILSERNRLACEIHDTLAQGLGAISMQLELAKNGTDGISVSTAQRLDVAHKLVRSSLAEARNSIWNMRSQVLENGDLASALKDILRQLSDGAGIEPGIAVTGTPRRLPPVLENNLLRIGQEAITNAVKHAHAHHVGVALDFTAKSVRLLVTDDGQGFDIEKPPVTEGGFGLVGMRERSAQMNGELTILSAPGQGTKVSLNVSG